MPQCSLPCFGVMLAVVLGSTEARAAILLDEFDDAAQQLLPQMSFQTVVTNGVGELPAQRSIRLGDVGLSGVMSVDVQAASALFVEFEDLISSARSSFIDIEFWYAFAPIDASQGGINDGILLDFRWLDGMGYSARLDAFATDDITGRHSTSRELPSGVGPFTVAIPFTAFADSLNVDQLQGLTFRVRLNRPQGVLPPGFAMSLDRIRFARVPEPSAGWLGFAAAVGVMAIRRATTSSHQSPQIARTGANRR